MEGYDRILFTEMGGILGKDLYGVTFLAPHRREMQHWKFAPLAPFALDSVCTICNRSTGLYQRL